MAGGVQGVWVARAAAWLGPGDYHGGNEVKILCLVYANRSTGYGHWFRSLALAQTAQQCDHTVTIAGDRRPSNGLPFIHLHDLSPGALVMALQATKPDWLIVDLPGDLPEWIRELTKCRICTLNGIGYNQADGADLRVIQGVDDVDLPGPQDKVPVLKGIEYVILRPEIEQFKGLARSPEDWFVFGGGADVLRLLSRFTVACPGWFATLITSPMAPAPLIVSPTHTTIRLKEESADIFGWMSASGRGCVAMGMCVWELLAVGPIPTYVFSATTLHLRFAEAMARHGLIKAWPTVGLPSNDK